MDIVSNIINSSNGRVKTRGSEIVFINIYYILALSNMLFILRYGYQVIQVCRYYKAGAGTLKQVQVNSLVTCLLQTCLNA